MVKRHLKRIAAPKRWHIQRKSDVFVTRPNPGAHSFELGLSLNTFLKEVIKVARTTKEVRGILNHKEILVDGKKRKDKHFMIGFMDVVEMPSINSSYRVSFDSHGRLIPVKIDDNKFKLSSITSKTKIKGGKTQLNLSDGRNLLVDKDTYKTHDTLLIEIPAQKIKEHLAFSTGCTVFIIGGKHQGIKAKVKSIKDNDVTLTDLKGKDVTTIIENVFVIGKDKEVVKISE